MRVMIATILETSAERAWAEVLTPRLFRHVARPLLTVKPIDPPTFPAAWREGEYRVRMCLFGMVPIGEQRIVVTEPMLGPDRYGFRDDGHGDLASRWDHRITIQPAGPSRCCYTDEIEVEAGLLTPFVWCFAYLLYAHRQRRWRALVRSGFAY